MNRRKPYLDLLRALAAFLVIVNHTNSEIFRTAEGFSAAWWISVVWFFCSKVAVPLFVMISGALLLDREESYKELFSRRILRIVVALVLFSLIIYLLDGGRSVGGFLVGLWSGSISTPLWYLYMYLALLLALPVLRKFVRAASAKDVGYFLAVWAVFVCAAPQLAALGAPEISKYLAPPSIFGEWVGFLVLGYALGRAPQEFFRKKWLAAASWVCVLLPIAFAALVCAMEQSASGALELRLERASLLTTALPSAALFALARRYFDGERAPTGRSARFLAVVGSTAFGVYLTHIILIRYTRPLYAAMSGAIGRNLAMLIYELVIFAVCVSVVWLLKKLPLVKKLF